MTEPTPVRDVGPFTTYGQARAQYKAQTFGFPEEVERDRGRVLVVAEAALLAGLELTDYEQQALRNIADGASVIVAGLILRASLGRKEADPEH